MDAIQSTMGRDETTIGLIDCSTRTGVSKAIHAIILGQRGACLSGRELAIARRVSAASKPPMLANLFLGLEGSSLSKMPYL